MTATYMLDQSNRQGRILHTYNNLSASGISMIMETDEKIEGIRRQLSKMMDRRGIKPTTLSLRVGKSKTLVKDLMEKTLDVRISTLVKLANALDCSVEDLISDDFEHASIGPDLYVKGQVAAGIWSEAFLWEQSDWQMQTGRPDLNVPDKHRYFLKVVGDSMDEIYPDGSLIECIDLSQAPEPKHGQRVLVARTRNDGMIEATVKEYACVDNEIWLIPRSKNPAHRAFKLSEQDSDIALVQIVGVVVSSMRIE